MHKKQRIFGADIFYSSDGKERQTVVFLHGDGHDCSTGAHILGLFTNKYKRIAIDRPGHGGSSEIAERTFGKELAVIEHVLACEKTTRPILIGHSSGASLATAYALHHPVRALILSEPLFCDPHKLFWYLPLGFAEKAYLSHAEGRYAAGTKFTGNEATEEELRAAAFRQTPTETLRTNLALMRGIDLRGPVQTLSAPILAIQSGHGLLSLRRHIRSVLGRLNNARIEYVPHGTHNSFLLQKEEARRIVERNLPFLGA